MAFGTSTISVAGAGKVIVATTGVLPAGSALSISSGATLALAPCAAPSTPVVQTVASLSFDGSAGSRLDIGNNEVIVSGTGPSAIRADIAGGHIFSTLSNLTEGVGYAADGGGTKIRYTVLGDTNLDGSVNFTDLLTLATNYGLTTAIWSQGDFNYDSTVNFSDLLTLAANYGVSLTPGEAQSAGISPAFSADWNLAVSEVGAAVPEPDCMVLITGGISCVLLRRRRESASKSGV